MGTRCSIRFYDAPQTKPTATVYRHWDGDPETMARDLSDFFSEVEKQCDGDNRFDDASYLAAKFIVWQAGKYVRDPGNPLHFLGVGVLGAEEPTDLSHAYGVRCDMRTARPRVAEEPLRSESK